MKIFELRVRKCNLFNFSTKSSIFATFIIFIGYELRVCGIHIENYELS